MYLVENCDVFIPNTNLIWCYKIVFGLVDVKPQAHFVSTVSASCPVLLLSTCHFLSFFELQNGDGGERKRSGTRPLVISQSVN